MPRLQAYTPMMRFAGQIRLHPSDVTVELRTYGFGVIPFDGKFTRFCGFLRYDPSTTDVGEVMLQIEAASLAMSNQPIRNLILGPEMMDAERFPELAFRGSGQSGGKGSVVVGDLTMHGRTGSLTLDYARSAGTATVTGRLRREAWGITGGQLIGGSIIRIRVVLPDPFTVRPV
jgi:polyisoprenoid-binding protein YceI